MYDIVEEKKERKKGRRETFNVSKSHYNTGKTSSNRGYLCLAFKDMNQKLYVRGL
jgi:hypothetical protein